MRKPTSKKKIHDSEEAYRSVGRYVQVAWHVVKGVVLVAGSHFMHHLAFETERHRAMWIEGSDTVSSSATDSIGRYRHRDEISDFVLMVVHQHEATGGMTGGWIAKGAIQGIRERDGYHQAYQAMLDAVTRSLARPSTD